MAGNAAVLLVTDVEVLPATAVLWTMQEFPEKTASGKGLSIVTRASHLGGKRRAESSSLDVVVSVAETPGHHSFTWLAEVSRTLKPGGVLIVQEPIARRDISPEETESLGQSAAVVQTKSTLRKRLLLAGFVGWTVVNVVDGVGLASGFLNSSPTASVPQQEPLFKAMAFKVTKPAWETGSSFSLQKKQNFSSVVTPEEVTDSIGVHGKVSLSNVNDFNINVAPKTNGAFSSNALFSNGLFSSKDLESDDLVDEDSLLTEEDLKKPEVSAAGDDCEVGKAGRKACKNCTCGRAELEEEAAAQPETELSLGQLENPQSACGSCGLGDAFRCSGCPYRGLPAFKLGEKISLPGSLLTADL